MSTELENKIEEVPWMRGLASCINYMRKEGYTEDFQVSKKGLHTFNDTEKQYSPEKVKIVNFYRFEGVSDPADSSILYVIETDDGKKGTLVDAYGAYADETVNKFIVNVNEIQKQIKT